MRLSQIEHKKILNELNEIGSEYICRQFNIQKNFISNIKKNRLNDFDCVGIKELRKNERYKVLLSLRRHVSDEDMDFLKNLVFSKGTQKEVSKKIGKCDTYFNVIFKKDKKNMRNFRYKEILNKVKGI